jgi:hypothetical protein
MENGVTQGPLPPGWNVRYSRKTGKRYYLNRKSGKTQVEFPSGSRTSPQTQKNKGKNTKVNNNYTASLKKMYGNNQGNNTPKNNKKLLNIAPVTQNKPITSSQVVNTVKQAANAVSGVKLNIKPVNAPVKANLPQPVRQNKPVTYESMKASIIARIKAGETIPLKPDIEKLYDLDMTYRKYSCLMPGSSESTFKDCSEKQLQEYYSNLKNEVMKAPVKANLPRPVVENKPQVITPTGGTCESLPPEAQEACIKERKIQRHKAWENKQKAIANGTYVYSEDELKAKKELEEKEAKEKEEKKKQAEINKQEAEKFDIAINKSIKDDELKFTIDNKKRRLYDIPKLESEITNLLEENPEFKKELYSTCDISRSPEKCKDIIEDRLYYYISHNMSKEILDADYTIDDIQTNINRLGKPYIEYIKKELQFHPYLAGALKGLSQGGGKSRKNRNRKNKSRRN